MTENMYKLQSKQPIMRFVDFLHDMRQKLQIRVKQPESDDLFWAIIKICLQIITRYVGLV